jgi:hypothetical protein
METAAITAMTTVNRKYSVNRLRYCPTFTPASRRYPVTLKLFPGAVAGVAQVVHFWAIPQQSAGSVNSYG